MSRLSSPILSARWDGQVPAVLRLNHTVTALAGSLEPTEADEGANRLALRDIAQGRHWLSVASEAGEFVGAPTRVFVGSHRQ